MFTDPLQNLKAFGLREIDIVADLGAGTGFYSILAARIANRGKVYAVEVSRDFLHTIVAKTKEAKVQNVECLWGNIEKRGGTKIADSIVDKVIASNVLFQVEDKLGFISEIKRILKREGEVMLIDWSNASGIVTENMVVPKLVAKEMFEKNGFVHERDIEAGAEHYGMIFKKG